MKSFDPNQTHTIKFVTDNSDLKEGSKHYIFIDYYDANLNSDEITLSVSEAEYDIYLQSISEQVPNASKEAFDDHFQSQTLVFQPTENISFPYKLLETINDKAQVWDIVKNKFNQLDPDTKNNLIGDVVNDMGRTDQGLPSNLKQNFEGMIETRIDYDNIDKIIVNADEHGNPTFISASSNGDVKRIELDNTYMYPSILDEISKLYLENTDISSTTTVMNDLESKYVTVYENPVMSDELRLFLEITPAEFEYIMQPEEDLEIDYEVNKDFNIKEILLDRQNRLRGVFLASGISNINLTASLDSTGRKVPTMIELFTKDLKTMAAISVDIENPSDQTEKVIEVLEDITNELALVNSDSLIQQSADVNGSEDNVSALYGGENIQVASALLEILSGEHELSQSVSIDFSQVLPGVIDLPLYGQNHNSVELDGPDVTDSLF